MQKRLASFGLLFFMSSCLASLEDQGDSMQSMLMYGMLGGNQHMTFAESFDRGLKLGVVRGISGPTGRVIESIFGGAVTRMSSAVGSLRKFVLHSIYKNNDFDVREIFGWRSMLESSITTHILNVAKGARVVRAHVLSQEAETKSPEQQALHGVQVLKRDMVYMVNKLNEYEPYYTTKADDKQRSAVDRILDYAALAGGLYVVGDCLIRKTSEKDAEQDVQHWQTVLEKQQQNANPDAKYIAMLVDRVAYGVKQFGQTSSAYATHTNDMVKAGLAFFAVVRLVQWLRSSEAIKAADMLSDVNRDLVVHMLGSLRSNLNHLISLCDGIKEESDLVRVKDDFEFIGKNCGEALLQIAYLVDQAEALTMQKLGKPGQNPSAFGQGFGGFNAALPKL